MTGTIWYWRSVVAATVTTAIATAPDQFWRGVWLGVWIFSEYLFWLQLNGRPVIQT
jgi:hypothetical protein